MKTDTTGVILVKESFRGIYSLIVNGRVHKRGYGTQGIRPTEGEYKFYDAQGRTIFSDSEIAEAYKKAVTKEPLDF